jgi:2-polyprenyl-6-methoxyphenol hydroxylase-like FAD-dependent oxidoreductase
VAAVAVTPAMAVAGSGLIGAALALWLAFDWRREPAVITERNAG